MNPEPQTAQHFCPYEHSRAVLTALGIVSLLLYAGIAWLSELGRYTIPGIERPLIEMLCLLAGAFILYLVALRVALRAKCPHGVVAIVFGFAILFRGVLLFSEPIQEIDIYRYLWDGETTTAGVDPYRYSPAQVLAAEAVESQPDDLFRLVARRDASSATAEILRRVHFAELPSVYPPVSQAVFAGATLCTPKQADLKTRVIVMKAWITVFDLATLWLLIGLLRRFRRPLGWSLIYAWCPLVLKEFSNSGHLDAIAVCLTVLAVRLAVQLFPTETTDPQQLETRKRRPLFPAMAAAIVLGLAIGAKLYPLVLAPLLILVVLRLSGWKPAISAGVLLLIVSLVVCWPMFPRIGESHALGASESPDVSSPLSIEPVLPMETAPPSPGRIDAALQQPSKGLTTFLSQWEMNDFLFLLLIENFKPTEEISTQTEAWFTVTSNRWRAAVTARVSALLEIEAGHVPFLIARTTTAIAFLIVMSLLALRASKAADTNRFLEAAFLTLAWFWLLLPTQNPWYWIWAVPFLPFARSRAWLWLSGLTLIYYLRFWFDYHWMNKEVLSSGYRGAEFFDFVVTWIEFAPWFVWLAAEAAFRALKR